MSANADAAAARQLLDLINGSWIAQACYVTARLGIADLLAAGPRTAEDLAIATTTNAAALRRLLSALGSVDICHQRADGSFEMTRLGERLRADVPCSMRAWALQWGGEAWQVWANLFHSIKTGQSARTLVTGNSGFDHLERDPAAAEIFNQAMVDLTRLAALDIVRAYDFAGQRVMDVGGGYGELLAQILGAYPTAQGILFDMPHAISKARAHFDGRGLAGRCEFTTGDFFASVPSGADVYVLKTVIHDWPDDRARDILRSCRAALRPGARVLIIERLMPERLEPSGENRALARVDLHMLVALGAQERTFNEMRALLAAAGFQQVRRIETGSEFQILEAQP
ncbi:MAG TPA: methyltransferase [Steroidobacteraceae bacterium]|jgi:SAM-dependent methyltransferase|nr:methyltransferase [Steroidobacteraceae bacterium]